jgi:hypothetical protein
MHNDVSASHGAASVHEFTHRDANASAYVIEGGGIGEVFQPEDVSSDEVDDVDVVSNACPVPCGMSCTYSRGCA